MSDDKQLVETREHLRVEQLMNLMMKQVLCQEAAGISTDRYFACGMPAKYLVDNGDPRPYLMCEACTQHNVRNRRAVIIAKVESLAS